MAELVLRKRKLLRADVSMTADTGSENDCLWSTGERTDAREFYEKVIVPYCREIGIDAVFVRTNDKDGNPLPPLHEAMILGDTPKFVPVFGSRMGRMRQECTDKWKIRAMSQEARRRGATTLRSAIGLNYGEMDRVSGRVVGKSKLDGYTTFQCGTTNKAGVFEAVKWQTKYYPFIDRKMNREDCQKLCDEEGLPYIVSSQCDMCPHKNGDRWQRSTPATVEWAAGLEARFGGNFFLTDQRIPLQLAIPNMKTSEGGFCTNEVCGF